MFAAAMSRHCRRHMIAASIAAAAIPRSAIPCRSMACAGDKRKGAQMLLRAPWG